MFPATAINFFIVTLCSACDKKIINLPTQSSKKDSRKRLSFYRAVLTVLGRLAGAGGAHVNAGAAILAFFRIDHILAIASRNGAFGAFSFTSTATDAVTGNGVGHERYPFGNKLGFIAQ
jgi:hypothetical protein